MKFGMQKVVRTEVGLVSSVALLTLLLFLATGAIACGKKAPPEPLDSGMELEVETSRGAS